MLPSRKSVSEKSKGLLPFFKSSDFSKAVSVGIGVSLPIVIGIATGYLEIGLAFAFGAFWCSPSDTKGSYRHRIYGILFSAALVTLISFIGGYLDFDAWFLFPVLGVLTFAISYLAVFGFKASLISFSGLLALVLSFAHSPEELEPYQYSLLIGLGGLWYLLLVVIWQSINPKGQTEDVLSKTYTLTADFMNIRGKLLDPKTDHIQLQAELNELQSDLIENHETLRDILILSRRSSGQSNYQNKRLLVFIQLVEMLETATANPVNYAKMEALFNERPDYAKNFQNLIFEISNQLRAIASAGQLGRKFPLNNRLIQYYAELDQEISNLKIHPDHRDFEGFLILQNFLEYQGKQIEKLKKIKWLLGNPDMQDSDFIAQDAAVRFAPPQDYDPSLLTRNLNFGSNLFKHSLRLAIAVMVGYCIGSYFDFQNPYWILLTIIVIMRPSYGLTKSRTKQRIIGTLIGGAIATGLVFLIQNPYIYGVLGILSLVIAFSMLQKNYGTAATFITLSVIFIYAIIRPDVLNVIQYRILDTLIGAALSFLGIWLLWPAWSFQDIESALEKSISANKNFLSQIMAFYEKKGAVPVDYEVSRKHAFTETSNLSAVFQGMVQEPISKQKNVDEIYELVVINHHILSSLASLSSYIKQHTTSTVTERFKTAGQRIERNLDQVLQSLKDGTKASDSTISDDQEEFKSNLPQLADDPPEPYQLDHQLSERNFKEAHLVREQLEWLFSLSEKMLRVISKTKLV